MLNECNICMVFRNSKIVSLLVQFERFSGATDADVACVERIDSYDGETCWLFRYVNDLVTCNIII